MIITLVKKALTEVIASGHVEWYVKPNVDQRLKEFNDKNKLNTLLLNTTAADKGNDQRFMRTLLSSMKHGQKQLLP